MRGRDYSEEPLLEGARSSGFTLVELLVAIAVLTLLLVTFGTLLNSISQTYNRSDLNMNALLQARFALDRIGYDLDKRLTRDDVPISIQSQAGNDAMLFYAAVGSATLASSNSRGIALVAYRINQSATGTDYELQRAANGISWDATNPLVTINPAATTSPVSPADADYDTASLAVFRMECSIVNKTGTILARAPSDPLDFFQNVAAIVVTVAALDPKARLKLSNANTQLALLVAQLPDAVDGSFPGESWAQKISNINSLASSTGIPVQVLSSIRIATRTYHVN